MWMIDPNKMCKRHISGEHNEIHKHLPSLYAGVSVEGRMAPVVQIQLNALQARHDELAQYLNHKSPLEVDDGLIRRNYGPHYYRMVDVTHNEADLANRCEACRKLIWKG
jgi:hypothetical protein